VLESMPDEGNVPEKANLGPQMVNPARRTIIRPREENPGLGQGNPGLAQPGYEENRSCREILARPDPPDPAQPGKRSWQPSRGRAEAAQPGGKVSAQPGWTVRRGAGPRDAGMAWKEGPGGTDMLAQPGDAGTGPAGE
jgi:hypothetical protein